MQDKKPKILLAEDTKTSRDVIAEQLRLLGYACDVACDGEEALALWRKGDYALLLTDCHMPRLDGFELTRLIREVETRENRCPVIAVTANAMQGEAEYCKEKGMDDYLPKPMLMKDLGAMLAKWLQGEVVQSGVETEVIIEDAAPLVWDALALTRMVGDNPTMHRRLLERFLIGAEAQTAQIETAAGSGECAIVAELAHKLKSGSRTVGAMELGHLCQRIEWVGLAGDVAECRIQAASLSVAFLRAAEKINVSLV